MVFGGGLNRDCSVGVCIGFGGRRGAGSEEYDGAREFGKVDSQVAKELRLRIRSFSRSSTIPPPKRGLSIFERMVVQGRPQS